MKIVAQSHGKYDLCFDTDDIEEFSVPRDSIPEVVDGRETGKRIYTTSHLDLKFTNGSRSPWWEKRR